MINPLGYPHSRQYVCPDRLLNYIILSAVVLAVAHLWQCNGSAICQSSVLARDKWTRQGELQAIIHCANC